MKITRAKIHETCYFIALIGLAIGIPLSNFMMSLFTMLLLVNWLIEGNFKEKFGNKQRNLITLCFAIPYIVHILWMINTADIAYGLDDLRRKIPLLIIPLVVFTSKALPLIKYRIILTVYVACIFIASVYAFIHFALNKGIEYRDMVTFISHIRFSLNICMTIPILLVETTRIIKYKPRKFKYYASAYIIIILWFLVFLTALRSYTAFVILFIISLVFVLYCLFNKDIRLKSKRWVGFSYFFLLLLFIGYETYIIYDYYTPKGISQEPLKEYTKKGNPYFHAKDGLIENGHYINDYICEQEIREAWRKKNYRPLDKLTDNGNGIYETLIRYLNSKGLPKDAEGIEQLSEKDIRNITCGYANYYSAEKVNFKTPTYQLLFELELYKNTGYYLHSSTFQRFHLWGNALQIIKNQPFFGTGTGDVAVEFQKQLEESGSFLKGTSIRAHNQYLTFILSFGVIGFLIIFCAYFYIIRKTKIKGHFLFLSFLIILLCSMISEDTLETQAGVTLFSFFFAFFVRMKDFDKIDTPKLLGGKGN